MKIEVGKRYVRRDGSITDALVDDPWGWPEHVMDPEDQLVFTTKGGPTGHQVLSYEEGPKDLMREYTK